MVTGAGERAFCVGSDLKQRRIGNKDDHPPTGFGGISHRFDLMKPEDRAKLIEGMSPTEKAKFVTSLRNAVALGFVVPPNG